MVFCYDSLNWLRQYPCWFSLYSCCYCERFLKALTITVDVSVFPWNCFSFFSCILKLLLGTDIFCVSSRWIGLFIIMKWPSLSLVILFVLKYTFMILIQLLQLLLWWVLTCYIFFHSLTLFVSSYLKCSFFVGNI